MESEHTQIDLNDGKLEISWGKSKNTDFLEKYRPFLTIFLKKSVLQTKIIYTDRIVITAPYISPIFISPFHSIRVSPYMCLSPLHMSVRPPYVCPPSICRGGGGGGGFMWSRIGQYVRLGTDSM